MRLGADPDHLVRLSRLLERTAATAERIRRDVRNTGDDLWWAGADRAEFERRRADIALACATAATRLRIAAADVARQAAEQEHASTGAEIPARHGTIDPAHGPRTPPGRVSRSAPAPSVMWLDPSGDGREVVTIGDPTTARHVAVIVPGIGTTLTTFDTTVAHARDLWLAVAHDHPDAAAEGVAVIAWLGYDAPGGFLEPERFGEMLTSERADEGALSLRRFLRHLDRRDDSSVTLIGHSYGSLVVATAAAHGNAPDVDRVVALGSPGLGVNRVADLGLGAGTTLYAAAAPGDPVSHTQWFGTDPTLPRFGAEVISADGPSGSPPPLATVHSSYFAPGSDALHQLATVVIGGRPNRAEPTPLEGLVDPLFAAVGLPYLPEPLRRPAISVAGMLGDAMIRSSGQRRSSAQRSPR